jgi:hypothetical protein
MSTCARRISSRRRSSAAVVAVLDDGAVRLRAQATIDRKEFGVKGNLMGMVPDTATISGAVVFRRAG